MMFILALYIKRFFNQIYGGLFGTLLFLPPVVGIVIDLFYNSDILSYGPPAFSGMLLAGYVIAMPVTKKAARKRLPAEGTQIGLEYHPSELYSDIGTFTGKIRGFDTTVKPDESSITIVFQNKKKEIELSTNKPYRRPAGNMTEFTVKHRGFDTLFRTCRANPDVVNAIKTNRQLPDALVNFYIRWLFRIKAFQISDTQLSCQFNYGSFIPHWRYLPVGKLDMILIGLINLTEILEHSLPRVNS